MLRQQVASCRDRLCQGLAWGAGGRHGTGGAASSLSFTRPRPEQAASRMTQQHGIISPRQKSPRGSRQPAWVQHTCLPSAVTM